MEKTDRRIGRKFSMLLVALLLSAFMIASVIQLPWGTDIQEIPTTDVGADLLENFWFAIIILGLLLAAGMLGGIYLAKIDPVREEEEDDK